jgi:hypothetical protein
MSYCQWNGPTVVGWAHPSMPRSDLYIYDSASHGALICCSCSLDEHDETFVAADSAAMVEHVKAHRAAGHHVWEGVEEDILADALELDGKRSPDAG